MTVDDRWVPGIGDPTAIGWVTVAAYLVCALLCFAAARKRRIGFVRRTPVDRNPASLWVLLAILMLVLGVNKQLDLQSLFTQTGRDLALSQGWYAQRAVAQSVFITGIAVLGALVSVSLYFFYRHASLAIKFALLGFVFLLSFVVIRAASFHHVDMLLGDQIAGARLNGVLELGSLLLIALAAIATLASKREYSA